MVLINYFLEKHINLGEDGLKTLIQAEQKTREKELGTFFDK